MFFKLVDHLIIGDGLILVFMLMQQNKCFIDG